MAVPLASVTTQNYLLTSAKRRTGADSSACFKSLNAFCCGESQVNFQRLCNRCIILYETSEVITETQEATNLSHCLWRWPAINSLQLLGIRTSSVPVLLELLEHGPHVEDDQATDGWTSMSPRNTITNLSRKGPRTPFIKSMNVAGVFVRPNYITRNWN